MKGQKTLFSSEKHDWETPPELFERYNQIHKFTIDLAASHHNTKLPRFYTEQDNSLLQDWNGEVGWCNPPYNNIKQFVKKAQESKGTFVFLLPARTDTTWFHDYVLGKASIEFLSGRIKFVGSSNSAPFPSMVVIYEQRT